MKTIGLIGGMSWESTVTYYQMMNRLIRERVGPLASAKILLSSVNFAEIAGWQQRGEWSRAGEYLREQALGLERAGADMILIGANTMHRVAEIVADGLQVPLLHIVDIVGETAKKHGAKKIGLLGTRYTMEGDFYVGRLREKHGLAVLVPDAAGKAEVHRLIYEELCAGKFLDESRKKLREIIEGFSREGAQAVVLGCTEISLLLKPEDSPLPFFDTTTLHAEAAVNLALGSQ